MGLVGTSIVRIKVRILFSQLNTYTTLMLAPLVRTLRTIAPGNLALIFLYALFLFNMVRKVRNRFLLHALTCVNTMRTFTSSSHA